MNRQRGFTLIELIMVIVILGILAAVAVPRFVDLSEEADATAIAATASALGSAAAINYAACVFEGKPAADQGDCIIVTTCASIANSLTADFDDKYQIKAATDLGATFGSTRECVVQLASQTSVAATFVGVNTD